MNPIFFFKRIPFLFISIFLSSCATYPTVQPQAQSLLLSGQYDRALKVLEGHRRDYGANNELLYFLDYGMALHLAGRYADSAAMFEKAKLRYDELYTRSISQHTASWLMNDYTLPYRGEDFERVMVNIFQAMNYSLMGHIPESLVEARNVNSVLTAINLQYSPDQKNVYSDDAFARLLMGLLYEASGSSQGVNDAFISYRKALDLYERAYKSLYGFSSVPTVLKENLLTAASFMGTREADEFKERFSGIHFIPLGEKERQAQAVLVVYHGMSPNKVQDRFIVPAPDGQVLKFVFPKYQKRVVEPLQGDFCARASGFDRCAAPELGEDMAAIAIKNLQNRKMRIMMKAGLRPLLKAGILYGAQYALRNNGNGGAADGARAAGIFYGLLSEQTDLRSWQLLPAQIWIARVLVPPGEYRVSFGSHDFGLAALKAGETKFFMLRSW